MTNNIYDGIRNLIETYVFGGGALTTNQDLITELISMFGCVILVSLPFILVFRIIKIFF